MFIYYFVHVNRPYREVESSLVNQLHSLGPFADAAYREGEELRDKVSVRLDNPSVAKTVSKAMRSGFGRKPACSTP